MMPLKARRAASNEIRCGRVHSQHGMLYVRVTCSVHNQVICTQEYLQYVSGPSDIVEGILQKNREESSHSEDTFASHRSGILLPHPLPPSSPVSHLCSQQYSGRIIKLGTLENPQKPHIQLLCNTKLCCRTRVFSTLEINAPHAVLVKGPILNPC